MGFLQRADNREEWYIHSRNMADEAFIEGPYTKARCDAIGKYLQSLYFSVEIQHHEEKPEGNVTRMPDWEIENE